MGDIVIQVENLWKEYRLGVINHHTLTHDLQSWWSRVRGKEDPNSKVGLSSSSQPAERFWALRDISLNVEQGDILGIVGRNGAGKSTLLKILSQVTAPTRGEVRLKGRIASLLEVGTGFHPELTGRENVFLNGAILGMGKAEVRSKLDEIIAFAEVEQFIDTPVKRYSSGMYVRLAFAVAAHLEPEILVVDEVLAVGDAQFQKKCLGKMEDVGREGRTVLFVSHNMGLVQQLCRKGLFIEKGTVAYAGAIADVVQSYLAAGLDVAACEIDLSSHPNRLVGMKPIMQKVTLSDGQGVPGNHFSQSDTIRLRIFYDTRDRLTLAGAGFTIHTHDGIRVGGGNTYMAFSPPHRIPSCGTVSFLVPARQLTPGSYSLTVSVGSHQAALEDKVEHLVRFTIAQADIYGTGYLLTKEDGVSALVFQAEVDQTPRAGDGA